MQEERLIELLIDIHQDLPRQGPGEAASTLRALGLCQGLPPEPDILDVGCGSGAQTLDLAKATRGNLTAVDFCDPFLEQLRAAVQAKGLSERVHPMRGDMSALPFPDASFDLIWSEGAVYIMGFDNGLREWRRLLKPGGCLAVTDIAWQQRDVPSDLYSHWMKEVPAMRHIEENLAAAQSLGYEVLGHFTLAERGWTEEYYPPLLARLGEFRQRHAGDRDAQQVADLVEKEVALFKQYSAYYGYEFYTLRRND